MNDTEQQLREMFERRASDIVPVAGPTPRTVRRSRRRRVATTAVAVLTALALLAVTVASLRALSPLGGTKKHQVTTATPSERTASVNGFVLRYPADWYAVSLSIPQNGAGIQLSNFDPGFPNPERCAEQGPGMPPDGVVLVLMRGSGSAEARWPADLRPADVPTACAGEALTAEWNGEDTVPRQAIAILGPEATVEDRQQLLDVFANLRFPDPRLELVSLDAGSAVLASGSVGNVPWALGAAVAEDGIRFSFATPLLGSGGAPVMMTNPNEIPVDATVSSGNTFLHGAVSVLAARVEVRPEGRKPFDAQIVDLPASMGASFRAFMAPMPGVPRGTIVAYDADGNVLAQRSFDPGGYYLPDEPPTPTANPSPGAILREGKAFGEPYRLVDTGSGVALVDASGNELASDPGTSTTGVSLTTYTFIRDDGDTLAVVFGTAPNEATYAVLFTSQLPSDAQVAPLSSGRRAYWTGFTPGTLKGQILVFDSNCELLGAVDLATGQAPDRQAYTYCDPLEVPEPLPAETGQVSPPPD